MILYIKGNPILQKLRLTRFQIHGATKSAEDEES